MAERAASGEPQPTGEAEIAIYGGVLTVKQLLPVYAPMLKSGPSSLPNKKRFKPIPRRHLAQPEDMQERFEEHFLKLHEKVGERMVVGGHSLGALIATKLGVKHPDKISDVICFAGAHAGIRYNTPSIQALKMSIRKPEIVGHIDHDSDFMQAHLQDMATSWSPDVNLHILSATGDDLIFNHGLGIELPKGQAPKRHIVAPRWAQRLGIVHGLNPSRPRDTALLPSRRITGHIDLPLSGAVISHVHAIRQAAAEVPLPDLSQPLGSAPDLMPVAA